MLLEEALEGYMIGGVKFNQQTNWCQWLTIDAVQHSPGGRLRGLRTEAVDFLRTVAQQEEEHQSDQEDGQQEDGHDNHLLLAASPAQGINALLCLSMLHLIRLHSSRDTRSTCWSPSFSLACTAVTNRIADKEPRRRKQNNTCIISNLIQPWFNQYISQH
ncbi:hypothetical protein EYF80_008789 [Liparis tanakae]|uniref:Uncharacterized protein n=1 Tax=Liparis tanakae TaxID=230148 RepID=A0A4Z2IV93_9TELE|nr:hypothetical protein EYF80_008789 [Liparis tanakae]